MRPQLTSSMQMPRWLPVQVKPVGRSNLFDSLRINEKQKQAGLLRNTPAFAFYRSRRGGEGAECAGLSKS